MKDMTPKDVDQVLDRAITLCAKYVPVEHRNPTPGGGNVLTTATALLVAARAVVAAVVELDAKPQK